MKKLFGEPLMIQEARQSRPGHLWILELLIFLAVLIVGEIAAAIPLSIAATVWVLSSGDLMSLIDFYGYDTDAITAAMVSSMPDWLTLVSLFATAATTLVCVLFCAVIEKRKLSSMGFRKKNAFLEYLGGAAAGILMITAAVVLGMVTGAYTVTPAQASVSTILIFLAGWILQGMSEEVLCRGYLMVSMSRKNPVWLSLLLSSIVFALLHMNNPGISGLAVLNLFLSGLVFGVYILKRGNIWGACALHTFWNFYQGNIYGISVSGNNVFTGTVFTAVQNPVSELWTGGAFGIEGGLCDTIVELAALLILIFLVPAKKSEMVSEAAAAPAGGVSAGSSFPGTPDSACGAPAAAGTAAQAAFGTGAAAASAPAAQAAAGAAVFGEEESSWHSAPVPGQPSVSAAGPEASAPLPYAQIFSGKAPLRQQEPAEKDPVEKEPVQKKPAEKMPWEIALEQAAERAAVLPDPVPAPEPVQPAAPDPAPAPEPVPSVTPTSASVPEPEQPAAPDPALAPEPVQPATQESPAVPEQPEQPITQ